MSVNTAALVAMGVMGLAMAAEADAAVRIVHRHRPVVVARPVVRTPHLRITVGGAVAVEKGYGRLRVEVEPERAQVYIDGDYEGRGDTIETLRAGKHTVRVKLADGREAAQTVDIDGGKLTVVRLEL